MTLQVSGMLWHRSLVIRDIETGSLWSHILGRCMQGPLKDKSFEFIPATLTTWKDWKTKHPDSTVLNMSRTASTFIRDLLDEQYPVGYGIKIGLTTAAYSYRHLANHPVYEDKLSDQAVVIVFDAPSTRTFAYECAVDDLVLTFGDTLQEGLLIDESTQSKWNPWTGEAVEGSLKGKRLRPVYGLITYMNAWENFYPDGQSIR